MNMKKIIVSILTVAFFGGLFSNLNAQDGNFLGQQNVITTAVPFLIIGPDARAGGLGEVGVATSPDAYSMHWNAAKYMFTENDMGIGVSYSPWLRNLVNDINLTNVTFHRKVNDRNGFAIGLRFFSLGNIQFTDENGYPIGEVSPNEWSISAAYTRKFSEHLSGAITFKTLRSNLTSRISVGQQTTRPGWSVASDVSIFYTKPLEISGLQSSRIDFGASISNIGAKISYSNDDLDKNFIPTYLRFGPGFHISIDDYSEFAIYGEVGKLLVPTPPVYDKNEDGNYLYDDNGDPIIAGGYSSDVSVATGMIQSFYDAPGGFQEEMEEFILSSGVEYTYNKQFSIRGGYFHESKLKGNRKFFTLGVGLKYNVMGIDISYLIPTVQHHPLENTLRVSLSFNFAGMSIGKKI